jgi:hypothetical protein
MPKDPQINFWMGELYERSAKLTRAWSRYVQAVLTDSPPAGALRGLDRLNRDPGFRASFSMADAEQLLEGRTIEFHPPGRFENEASATPVRLVELFSCIDHEATLAPELAFAALAEYYANAPVSFVQYHPGTPEPDPLASDCAKARAAFYGVETTPAAIFGGTNAIRDGGSDRDIDRLYRAYKAASLSGAAAMQPWRIRSHATVADGSIRGRVELSGPKAPDDLRLHLLLCEEAVMAVGANQVILHRHVARAAISPSDGFRVPEQPGTRTFEIVADTAAVGAALEKTIKNMEEQEEIEFLMRPTYVDARGCNVVAILQSNTTRKVLAADILNVQPAEDQP